MAAIKKLAVREENAMVARVQLSNMRQDRDEPMRGFGAAFEAKLAFASSPSHVPLVLPM